MRKQHETDIEEIMKNCLIKNNIEFVKQYPIRCKYGYIVDFFIPEKNLIVECDGEHWHKEGNSHDRKRDGYLNNRGFKMIRFRGQEIINHVQQCVDKIVECSGVL